MNRLENVIGTEIIRTKDDEIRLGHTFHEAETLLKFVLDISPGYFFEIGVHEGGLVHYMLPYLPSTIWYTGIEFYCDLIRPVVREMFYKSEHAQLMCMDCFDPVVFGAITTSPFKIVYCDGGNKAREIAHFKYACHPGDIIMCHDFYGFGREPIGVPPEAGLLKEVVESDVQIFEKDTSFERLSEEIFGKTRIIGWRKL